MGVLRAIYRNVTRRYHVFRLDEVTAMIQSGHSRRCGPICGRQRALVTRHVVSPQIDGRPTTASAWKFDNQIAAALPDVQVALAAIVSLTCFHL